MRDSLVDSRDALGDARTLKARLLRTYPRQGRCVSLLRQNGGMRLDGPAAGGSLISIRWMPRTCG